MGLASNNWWPFGGQKKLDKSALASSTPKATYPALPSTTTSPSTVAGSQPGAATVAAKTSPGNPYPDWNGGAAPAGYNSAGSNAASGGYANATATDSPGSTKAAPAAYDRYSAPANSSWAQTNPYAGAPSTPANQPASAWNANSAPPVSYAAGSNAATEPYGNYNPPAANSGYTQPAGADPSARYADARTGSSPRYDSAMPNADASPAGGSRYDARATGDSRYGDTNASSSYSDSRYAPAGDAASQGTVAPANYGTAPNAGSSYPGQSNYQPGATGYVPGATGYQPGATGYQPPGVPPYQSPSGPYTAPGAGTRPRDPHYRPGSTSDYLPTSSTLPGNSSSGGLSSVDPAAGVTPAGYAAPNLLQPAGALPSASGTSANAATANYCTQPASTPPFTPSTANYPPAASYPSTGR